MTFGISQTWDIYHWWLYSSKVVAEGLLPYRDFFIEYPPLSIIFFTIPRLFTSSPEAYARVFSIFTLVTVLLLAWLIAKAKKNSWIFLTTIAALFPFVIERYDIFVSAIVFLAVWSVSKKRYLTGWSLLAIGVLSKFYPVVLAPLFFIKNKSLRNLFIFCLVLLIGFGYPYCFFNDGFREFMDYHKERSLQIGSFYNLYLYPKSVINKSEIKQTYNARSFEIEFNTKEEKELWIKRSNRVMIILLFLSYLAVYFRRKEDIFKLAILPILAFIISNKLFAPQYLLWIVPFIPFLGRLDVVLLVSSLFLTLWYYGFYSQLTQTIKETRLLDQRLPAIQMAFLRNFVILLAFLRNLISGNLITTNKYIKKIKHFTSGL